MNSDIICRVMLHIVGENRLQNELLASFFEKESGLICYCNLHRKMPISISGISAEKHLVLLDCIGAKFPETWAHLVSYRLRCFSALFNAEPDEVFEKEALSRGIRGIFYRSESPQSFAEGIYVVLNNGLRYSQKILSSFINERHAPEYLSKNTAALTRKEREILFLILRDMKNPDIAEKLGVSIHTVKTHICRIYKKIGAKNRYQAMLWAKKHL